MPGCRSGVRKGSSLDADARGVLRGGHRPMARVRHRYRPLRSYLGELEDVGLAGNAGRRRTGRCAASARGSMLRRDGVPIAKPCRRPRLFRGHPWILRTGARWKNHHCDARRRAATRGSPRSPSRDRRGGALESRALAPKPLPWDQRSHAPRRLGVVARRGAASCGRRVAPRRAGAARHGAGVPPRGDWVRAGRRPRRADAALRRRADRRMAGRRGAWCTAGVRGGSPPTPKPSSASACACSSPSASTPTEWCCSPASTGRRARWPATWHRAERR